MAIQLIDFAGEETINAVANEAKKYAKKVSAVTITIDTTTDANATIYKLTQNGKDLGSIKVDKEKFVKEAIVVEVAADTIVDPSNPGTEEAPNYLEAGKYIKMTFENDADSVIYLKTSEIDADITMDEITAEEVAEMFKEDIALEFNGAPVTVESKGQQLNDGDIVKEGWVLRVSAPIASPTETGKSLTVIVVNSEALPAPLSVSEDGTKKYGDYTVTANDEKLGRITFYVDYQAI